METRGERFQKNMVLGGVWSSVQGPSVMSISVTRMLANYNKGDPLCFQTQLQQLRDMGISDENVARRALTATGGDLQAALELIFGDGVQ